MCMPEHSILFDEAKQAFSEIMNVFRCHIKVMCESVQSKKKCKCICKHVLNQENPNCDVVFLNFTYSVPCNFLWSHCPCCDHTEDWTSVPHLCHCSLNWIDFASTPGMSECIKPGKRSLLVEQRRATVQRSLRLLSENVLTSEKNLCWTASNGAWLIFHLISISVDMKSFVEANTR